MIWVGGTLECWTFPDKSHYIPPQQQTRNVQHSSEPLFVSYSLDGAAAYGGKHHGRALGASEVTYEWSRATRTGETGITSDF